MIEELVRQGCFKNCLDVVRVDGGYIPLRFSEYQMELFGNTEHFEVRSHCPAGICLDMETSSTKISISYEIDKGKARDWIYFDLYVNEMYIDSKGIEHLENDFGEVLFEIPQNNNKFNVVTIYLPCNVSIIIKEIQLAEEAVVRKVPNYKKNLLCLGDSITQGMNALKSSNTYPVQLSRFMEMNLLNQGIGGHYYDVNSIDSDLPFNPDIITVAYGTNDWGIVSSIEEFTFRCKNYMDKLSQVFNKSIIYVITPIWRRKLEEQKHTGSLYDISTAICEVCKDYQNVKIIDGLKLIPHMEKYYDDGLHPTDEGFLHLTVNLLKNIIITEKWEATNDLQ